MPQRPHFHFVSLSAGGAVPISDPWVVLDTNVLSTLTSMAWRGYRPERLQEQRAAHLLRWLKRYNVNVVNTSFAVVEGSGFHAGGVDSFEVTRRYLMFEGLRRLNAGQLQEFFDSGEGATAVLPGGAEALIGEVLDDVTTLLPTTFGPAYLVSLQLWECMEAGMDAVATSRRVVDMLAD